MHGSTMHGSTMCLMRACSPAYSQAHAARSAKNIAAARLHVHVHALPWTCTLSLSLSLGRNFQVTLPWVIRGAWVTCTDTVLE